MVIREGSRRKDTSKSFLKGITFKGASKKGKKLLDTSKNLVVVLDEIDMRSKGISSSEYKDTMVKFLVVGRGSTSVAPNIVNMGIGDTDDAMILMGTMVSEMASTIYMVVDRFNFEDNSRLGRAEGNEDGGSV